jgi:hypothetical protein
MASSDFRVVYRPTLEEANTLCSQIDRHMGLPNKDMERWTIPIECEDGRFAVQIMPDVAIAMRIPDVDPTKRSSHLRTERKLTAEERAETQIEALPVEVEKKKGRSR